MNIWTVRSDVKNYASALVVEEDDVNATSFIPNWPDFEGQRQIGNWKRFKATVKQNKPIANFTDIDPGILVCDSYALLKVRDLLKDEVEILPIEIDSLDMKILNVINVVDCLDEESSVIEYYPNSKDIRQIKQYSFNLDLLDDVLLFKIPQFSRTEVFCTDLFKELVTRNSLTGLLFEVVYSK